MSKGTYQLKAKKDLKMRAMDHIKQLEYTVKPSQSVVNGIMGFFTLLAGLDKQVPKELLEDDMADWQKLQPNVKKMENLIKQKWVIPEINLKRSQEWLKQSEEQWIKDLVKEVQQQMEQKMQNSKTVEKEKKELQELSGQTIKDSDKEAKVSEFENEDMMLRVYQIQYRNNFDEIEGVDELAQRLNQIQ